MFDHPRFGLLATLRPPGRTTITALAAALAGSGAQGCCDPAVATDTSSVGESSTTNEGSASESTGDMALPEWAIGSFSGEADKVGMTIEDLPWYPWGRIEITVAGTMTHERYGCTELQERQEFRWTLANDGRSLDIQVDPPADVFTFGAGHQVSALVVEPGDVCNTIMIRYLRVDPVQWGSVEYGRGNVCARPTGADGCTFTFEWCDGEPPAPCE